MELVGWYPLARLLVLSQALLVRQEDVPITLQLLAEKTDSWAL